jgi:hypothetical protein
MPPKDSLQARFAEELAKAPLHSPLGRWMQEHRAEVAAVLKGRRADWQRIAETFGAAGLRDHLDRKPTAETARQTWRVVAGRHDRCHACGKAVCPHPLRGPPFPPMPLKLGKWASRSK